MTGCYFWLPILIQNNPPGDISYVIEKACYSDNATAIAIVLDASSRANMPYLV